jgi:hypothetical protein
MYAEVQLDDYDPCVQFGQWMLLHHQILRHILFSDEGQFDQNAINNTRNSDLWSTDNPYGTAKRTFQYQFSENVCCGLTGDLLTRPFILEQV